MRRPGEKGMALLLVLVLLALLSTLLADWAFSSLVELRQAETFRDGSRAYYLARGGVQVGRMLLQEDRNAYDSLDESWALGIPGYPVGEGATVTIAIEDLDGRLDLNRIVDASGENPAPYRERLRRLLDQLGETEAETLGDALLDWIDRNDASTPGGAESSYYQGLTPPYRAHNAPLDTLDELLLVKGFTPELFARLAPFVTIHNGGGLNLNTASPEVLLCWDADMSADVAARLLEGRRAAPFKTLEAARDLLGIEVFSGLNRNLDLAVASASYRITVTALVNDGSRRSEALVDKSGDRILALKVY